LWEAPRAFGSPPGTSICHVLRNVATPDETEVTALREHLKYALYPELADDIEAVQAAISATAAGRFDEPIAFASGRVEKAVMVCAVLDLEPFVEARASAE
jgi:hypothetical protein